VEKSDVGAVQQTAKNDSRVTRVGRFIRRTSLDELPQLINVLKGHMSIVGPRPHALKTSAEGKLLADAVSDYAFRHRVRPGITGWAQVNGLRGELDSIHKLRQRVQYDMEYIENWSIGFDVHIVLRTIRLMFHDPYAY
jgi:lipopolysaccharide/colanic/teichoic acid biosynthesis glycosyltransferase